MSEAKSGGAVSTYTVIGAVDASGNAQKVSLAVPLPTSGSLDSTAVYAAGVALTPLFAFANVAASATDSNIVTGVTAKKIRVLAVYCVAGGTATNITFNTKPAGAGVAISALFANGANGGEVLPFSPVGWFETVAASGLTVTTGAGATTGIGVVYVTV